MPINQLHAINSSTHLPRIARTSTPYVRSGIPVYGPAAHSTHRKKSVANALEVAQVADAAAPAFTVVGAGFAGALGLSIWKFVTYSQLEYITAAMLSRWVPTDDNGAKVIQLEGGTRELYYYPKNVQQVVVVGEKVNNSLIEQAGMQAAMPAIAKKQSPANLSFAGAAAYDAVVSLGALSAMSAAERTSFIQEAVRVLKPSRPLIFLEKIPGGLPWRHIGSPSSTLDLSVLESLKSNSYFSEVQWDVANEGQDPYAVGVAFKSTTAPYNNPRAGSSMRGAEQDDEDKVPSRRGLREAAKKSKDNTKGFSGRSC